MDFSSKKYVKHLSMRVEQLWESVSLLPIPQEEKLNACFDKITVSLFPPMERGEVIEMSSDTSLAEAVHILATNQILCAPVWDVDALEDASWIDKYLGLIEFEGIVHWILHQAEILTTGRVVTGAEKVETSDNVASEAHVTGKSGDSTLPPVHSAGEAAVTGSAPLTVGGAFFEELTSSDLYRSTKVKDIAGSFRWAPFIPIQNSDTFLTLLLLLSKYRVKCLPLVESGEGRIDNFITQSSVIHMLSECTDFPWFESLGAKSLSEIGLPCMTPDKLAKVEEDQPVLQAFQLMCQRGIGAVPVVCKGGSHIVGNVSMRDIQFLLVVPEMYKASRLLTVKEFLEVTRNYLIDIHRNKDEPLLSKAITCTKQQATRDVILKLKKYNIHRLYVVNEEGDVEGVVTMRDLISKFVTEPEGYFGEFFSGWAPASLNSH